MILSSQSFFARSFCRCLIRAPTRLFRGAPRTLRLIDQFPLLLCCLAPLLVVLPVKSTPRTGRNPMRGDGEGTCCSCDTLCSLGGQSPGPIVHLSELDPSLNQPVCPPISASCPSIDHSQPLLHTLTLCSFSSARAARFHPTRNYCPPLLPPRPRASADVILRLPTISLCSVQALNVPLAERYCKEQ